MKFILGLDGGTQSSKVTIFDMQGNPICRAMERLRPMYTPNPQTAEHPDDDLWDSLTRAIRRAVDRFPHPVSDIMGLGLLSIRSCRVLLRHDGRLAQPVISWMDKRIQEPYQHDNPDVGYVTTTTGYITRRFTGQNRDTVANYRGMWPVDIQTWDWSEDKAVFEHFNIPRKMLFDLVQPGEILGYLNAEAAEATGLPQGLPVIATSSDKAAEGLGTGLADENTLLISLGTYITGMVCGNHPEVQPIHYWVNCACQPDRYLYELFGIWRGMWTVSWFRDLMGKEVSLPAAELNITEEEYLNKMAEKVPPGSDGLLTIPDWLTPSKPFRRGSMFGFDVRHTSFHLYRSILEGIALTIKKNADAMLSELGRKSEKLIVSGGGSNGDLFVQIFSDVFGLSASRNTFNEAAGLGSAIAAAVGTGLYPDFDTAVANMVHTKDTFLPSQQNHALYAEILGQVYGGVHDFTDPMYQRLDGIIP